MVLKYLLTIFILSITLHGWAQKNDAVPVWGIYIDLNDPDARQLAKTLTKTGFKLEYDIRDNDSVLMLLPSNLKAFTKGLNKRFRDKVGIEVWSGVNCENESLKDSVIRLKKIHNNFRTQYSSQLPWRVPKRIQSLPEEEQFKVFDRLEGQFKSFLKGHGRVSYTEDMSWVMLGVPTRFIESDQELTFRFYRKNKPLAVLRFDTLYGEPVQRIQAIKEPCKPFSRELSFAELNSSKPIIYNALYRPRDEILSGRKFELKFEKNKSDYSPEMIQPIIDLLIAENLSVVSAAVEGFASVEGLLENNQKLQSNRARILIDLLEKYNDEKIELDSVVTIENWELFFSQIEETDHAWLLKFSKDSIKYFLTEDTISTKLEPFLAKQRTASITVKLTQRLSDEEKYDRMIRDFQTALIRVCSANNVKEREIWYKRSLSILDYMETRVGQGVLDKNNVLKDIGSSDLITDLAFEKIYSDFTFKKKLPRLFELESALFDAHDLFVRNYQKYRKGKTQHANCIMIDDKYFSKLVNLQLLVLELEQKELLPQSSFCRLSYPDNPRFYGLILNQYKHLSRLPTNRDCSLLEANSQSFQVQQDPNMRYYLLLKKIVMEKDENILKYVYRSDRIFEIDLYTFLKYNVDYWDSIKKTYFDPDISEEVMFRLIKRLVSLNEFLCPTSINQLRLDFDLKIIQGYYEHGLMVKEDGPRLTQSMDFIKKYVIRNISHYSTEEVLDISKQFTLLNHLYFGRTGTHIAYQIIKAAEKSGHELNTEHLVWKYRLAYYHDPSFISMVQKETRFDTNILFTGKYNLIPYGSLCK